LRLVVTRESVPRDRSRDFLVIATVVAEILSPGGKDWQGILLRHDMTNHGPNACHTNFDNSVAAVDDDSAQITGNCGGEVMKLSDQLYDRIHSLIVSGEYPEATRLPTEYELCAKFGVSRPTLREALVRLRKDGLITSRQGSGSFVAKRPEQPALLFPDVDSLADVRDGFTFRRTVEGGAAALAASVRTAQQLQALRRAFKRLDEALKAGEATVDADYGFHTAIANITGNRFFINTLAALHGQMSFAMRLGRSLGQPHRDERIKRVQAEHRAVLEAIEAGDPRKARREMERHIDNAARRLFGRQGSGG
jgi:GntR family transcriptional repressor for pyruvate dehydrogenase complex